MSDLELRPVMDEEKPHVVKYAPPAVREKVAAKNSPLQSIAREILRLTWRDAEEVGKGIKSKMKDQEGLTAAIMAWAAEFEEGRGE